MYSATFIFDAKQFDAEFHRLDALIAEAARKTEGYLGEEAWEDPKTGRVANVYYWVSESGLKQLIEHPNHIEAKRRYSEWLAGYQVIISHVVRTYGDKTMSHATERFESASFNAVASA
ncbi:antibiotic biosynthesis monooxygenase [Undibacterium sp.]|jgi:heme-degrading monooxygenase HmoA|uniref:antibiotic biosynthesis monooxygenase family protein n=1 Tax=Undibacterium sp. TaxID=1914977 RepID=UPI002CBF2DB4|nr:antibiotic biosynthesis monooxygenase [Undibacterium sp.]HTD07145.1 antibiotic biosynthesis monooxygenase [Undibacterium sp.]